MARKKGVGRPVERPAEIVGMTAAILRRIQDPKEVERLQFTLLSLKSTSALDTIRLFNQLYQAGVHAEGFTPGNKETIDYYRGKVDGAAEFLGTILEAIMAADAKSQEQEEKRQPWQPPVPPRDTGDLSL